MRRAWADDGEARLRLFECAFSGHWPERTSSAAALASVQGRGVLALGQNRIRLALYLDTSGWPCLEHENSNEQM